MKNVDWKEIGLDVLVDIVAGMLIAVGVYNFALNANFPVAGFSGIAIIMYHLLGLPVGIGTIILNIPVRSSVINSWEDIFPEVREIHGDFFCTDGLCRAVTSCL